MAAVAKLDRVAAGFEMRAHVLRSRDAADPDDAEFQIVLADNARQEPHLIQRGLADRVTGDARAFGRRRADGARRS